MTENNVKKRILRAMAALLIAVTVGTVGFWILEGGRVPLSSCLYMTVITLSTVGYGEVIPMSGPVRAFTSFLIVFGMGTLIYFGSVVVAFWVELDMTKVRRRRKMQRKIATLKDHVIVCGIGTTGAHVARELFAVKTPFIMIDSDAERLDSMHTLLKTVPDNSLYIVGDATEDAVLKEAGIDRARGLVAALRNDKDNLYIILSARQTNPGLRIVARAMEKDAPSKMLRAGADQVVSPNLIGGRRIASEMVRPEVVEFLDMMMLDLDKNTRIEQVTLPPGSPLVGKKLSDANIRKLTDVLVIAIRHKDGKYSYNPGSDTELTADATMIVLGAADSVIRLRQSIAGTVVSRSLIH